MSIPLKTACCATTVALAMAPGIAEAAEHSDKIPAPVAPGGVHPALAADQVGAVEASSRLTLSNQVAEARATTELGVARASSQARIPARKQRVPKREQAAEAAGRPMGGRQGGTRLGKAELLASMQQAVRAKRARMEAQWQQRANRAVRFALDQRGRPYVYGDTGRRGFDCSGLVQQAWRRAGVSVPRVAAAQYQRIRNRVARNKLRPGDLVFFHGLGHVGLYLGKSRFIHAPRTGRRISVERLSGHYRASYVGAVRPAWKPLPAIPERIH
ncbi:C40 family peptidase [Spirillospora sp. NPDC048911]|uniref:C40 family peptidase n=1 Tax=Spirillospora sp. NPDC048911 TaxID=3364527 RepID=UPI003712CDA2